MVLPTNVEGSDGVVEPLTRKPREYELDLLIAHELATGSPAAQLCWDAVEMPMPPAVMTRRQVRRQDRRTSDVVATDGDFQLHCEDKLADGVEEPCQLKSLAKEVERFPDLRRALVVAPRECLRRFDVPARLEPLGLSGLVTGVAVEDLATALDGAADARRSSMGEDELGRSYLHRAAALRALCTSTKPTPKESAVAFRAGYDAVLAEDSAGTVELNDEALVVGGSFARFRTDRPMPSGFQLVHKLGAGFLDVSVPGWPPAVLRTQLDSLPPESQLPDGWLVEVPPKAKSPVLRHRAPTVPGNLSTLSPDTATQAGIGAARDVAEAALEIATWLKGHDAELRGGPTAKTLRYSLDSAAAIAGRLGLTDIEKEVGRLVIAITDLEPHQR